MKVTIGKKYPHSSKKNNDKPINIWLSSFKIFAKITVYAVSCVCLVVASLFCFLPSTSAKVFEFFGMSKAEESAYERVYKKSGSTSDLYNLILFEMEHENAEKELGFIREIYKASDYGTFCAKLDKSGVASANGNKSLYPYVADVNAFLMGQEMKCSVEVALEKKTTDWQLDIIKLARKNLKSGSLTENSFYTLINSIYTTEKLTLNEKQVFMKMISMLLIDDESTFNELLENRLSAIDDGIRVLRAKPNKQSEDEIREILLAHSKVQLILGRYYFELLSNLEETDLAKEIKQQYENAREDYNNLIK